MPLRNVGMWLAALTLLAATPLPAETQWIDVPWVKQPREGCGAAAIAMVMRYWEARAAGPPAEEVSAIQRALYDPALHGIGSREMETYFRGHGYSALSFAGIEEDLGKQIARGRPLIVALGAGPGKPLHYVVVIGVGSNDILVNDPEAGKLQTIRMPEFDKRWTMTGRWTLLAVPNPRP